jgi:MarR family 2-MHQ and catechol resistance regulon transcriptional repressor
MPAQTDADNKLLNAWLLLHQSYKLVSRLEDIVFAKIGITTQQHSILAAIRNISGPVTPSELSNWLLQNPNGISMLVNRMEKDGLVKRIRDSHDRRVVQLTMTKKGEKILEQSYVVGWQLIMQVMAEFQRDELDIFIQMHERLREVAFARLNPRDAMNKKIETCLPKPLRKQKGAKTRKEQSA